MSNHCSQNFKYISRTTKRISCSINTKKVFRKQVFGIKVPWDTISIFTFFLGTCSNSDFFFQLFYFQVFFRNVFYVLLSLFIYIFEVRF